jgi:hypothetical protein
MLIPFRRYIYIISSMIKKSERNHKSFLSRFLFIYLLVDGGIRIRTNKLRIRMRIQEAQKNTDPTDRSTAFM